MATLILITENNDPSHQSSPQSSPPTPRPSAIDTTKDIGDFHHLKVFASEDAAEKWFTEHDPEDVAFVYDVME
jgi:hypothetical protein